VQGLAQPDTIDIIALHPARENENYRTSSRRKTNDRPKKVCPKFADRFTDAYLFAAMDMGLDWVRRVTFRPIGRYRK